MRKLVLFGVLGFVFGLALLLEHFVTRPGPRRTGDQDHLVAVFGGGTPREIPATPPDEPEGAPGPDSGKGDRPGRSKSTPNPGPKESERSNPPVANAKEHVVLKGETLASIARAELGTANRWRDLALWNGIDDPGTLQSGARLRLSPSDATAPAPAIKSPPAAPKDPAKDPPKDAPKEKSANAAERTHRIAKGDTLSHIAAQYLGDASRWREIQRLNAITDPANLTEGRILQLPPR